MSNIAEDLRRLAERATRAPWTDELPKVYEDGPAKGFPRGVAVASTGRGMLIYADPPGGTFPSADRDLIVFLRNHAALLAASVEVAEACAAYHDSGKKVDRRQEALAAYRALAGASS